MDFLLFIEEDTKEEEKIEEFKSTVLQSFPSKKMYDNLYGSDDEERWEEAIPETEDEYVDLLDLIKSVNWGNDEEIA